MIRKCFCDNLRTYLALDDLLLLTQGITAIVNNIQLQQYISSNVKSNRFDSTHLHHPDIWVEAGGTMKILYLIWTDSWKILIFMKMTLWTAITKTLILA